MFLVFLGVFWVFRGVPGFLVDVSGFGGVPGCSKMFGVPGSTTCSFKMRNCCEGTVGLVWILFTLVLMQNRIVCIFCFYSCYIHSVCSMRQRTGKQRLSFNGL